MNRRLSLKQVLIIFLVVLGIIFTLAHLAYDRLVSLVESNERINQNNDFVLKLEEVISHLKDAETGARGYLLTSDTVFLRSQKLAGKKVLNTLVGLRHQVQKKEEQIKLVDTIQNLAQKKIDNAWEIVHSIKAGEAKIMSERQKWLIVNGNIIMDSLRKAVQNLKDLEQNNLKNNKENQARFAQSSPRFLLIIIIWAISIIIFTMYTIYRQLLLLNKGQKKLEGKINELAIANRELDEYAFTLTHHLQEPLRKIRLFSSRYETKFKKMLNTEGGDELKSIQKINALAADSQYLLDEFLAFAQLNHYDKNNIEIVDLQNIIKDIWEIKKELVVHTKAKYHLEGETLITGYKENLIILFEQLIDNSLKFGCPERPLVIKIVGQEAIIDTQAYSIIHISDNGIGFEQQYAQKVFTIFQRLNSKNDYNGLGVGLAISQKIVELHRGQISVESNKNFGTTFTIKLPLKNI